MCMPCATPFSFQIWEGWYKLLQTCQSLVKSKLELPSTSLRLPTEKKKVVRYVVEACQILKSHQENVINVHVHEIVVIV